jgi:hypothetical protein
LTDVNIDFDLYLAMLCVRPPTKETHMDLRIELLASARAADLEREAAARRLSSLVATCRRWVLGIFPVEQPCAPCPSTS